MLEQITNTFSSLRSALNEIIVGQEQVIDQLLLALLADGHILLEGVPGTAKTTLAKTLAALVGADFGRIQLTPDMLPSDILGNSIYDLNSKTFNLKKGPVFTSFLLADEINRTPPKTQSALLEAMEERQISLNNQTYPLSELFLVIATQNPLEFEGTYPLPEAQLDRFMLKVVIGYPDITSESIMLHKWQSGVYNKDSSPLKAQISPEQLLACRKLLPQIKVEESLFSYLTQLAQRSRKLSDLQLGASPRAILHWLATAKAHAAIEGKDYVTPDNIKFVALPVLRHRLILTAEAELEGITVENVINNLLGQIPVPR